MKLVFNKIHLSIHQFNPIEMPNFVVLTGENGSGKSHLLEAINNQHVLVEDVENLRIALFNYENFRLDNETECYAHQIFSEREAAWKYYEQHVKPNFQNQQANSAYAVKNFFNRPDIKRNPQAQAIHSIVENRSCQIHDLTHDDFLKLYKPYTFKNDFLPQQLGRIIWDYYHRYRNNQVNRYENEKNGMNYPVMEEEDFIAIYGQKPWILINEILETFHTLKYRVPSPESSDNNGSFQLKLRHIENPVLEIEFSQLSSGERVLMALVASVYRSATDGHFPDLLLLDEVDASLHPSMMKNMLNVIEHVFLQHGVKVILVTHSPTTLALAPEESIYIMNRSGLNRIEKKSKAEALSILTQGFATIEQGLHLLDQVAQSKITLLTEGHNSEIIKKALELYGVIDVTVLKGIEDMSGETQLKTLFDFFAKIEHENKVIFVWDCDSSSCKKLEAKNNTFPFRMPRDEKNQIAKKGIENAFPEALFSDYKKTITPSQGEAITMFDDARKKDFQAHIISRNTKEDFVNFSSLIEEINRIRNS